MKQSLENSWRTNLRGREETESQVSSQRHFEGDLIILAVSLGEPVSTCVSALSGVCVRAMVSNCRSPYVGGIEFPSPAK